MKTEDDYCPISIRFTYSGKRVELSTGIYAASSQCNEPGQLTDDKIPGAKVNNEHLDRIQAEIQDILTPRIF